MRKRLESPPLTLETALERIGEAIERERMTGRQTTLRFEVSLNERHEIAEVCFIPQQPPKVRIA